MDDEIDLRAYAELIWQARRVITGITLAAALVAFVTSRFVLPKVYEASAMVVVEAPLGLERGQLSVRLRGDGSLSLDEQPTAPVQVMALTPAGYQQIAESEAFQALLRAHVRQSGNPASHSQIRVKARVVPQTNLLELTAEAPQPELAARWVNEAAALLLQEAERLNQARMERALELLESQIQQSKKTLEEAQARLQEFTDRGPSVDRLRNEQNVKLKVMGDYETRLAGLNAALVAETRRLDTLKAKLAEQSRTITLRRVLVPENAAPTPGVHSVTPSGVQSLVNLQDEQLNPVYVELQQQVALQEATVAALKAERDSVQTTLRELSQELQTVTAELVRVEAELQDLTWQVDAARRNYETALSQYEAQRSLLAGRLGASTLTLVRPAVAPEAPARPKTLLNTVVAGFMGLMVSVFGAFFAEFWRQPRLGAAGRTSGATAHGS